MSLKKNNPKAIATKNSNKPRCSWANPKNPLYIDYHDKEWGRPLHDEREHFELICLEGQQAGLSWECILNKRNNYRKAFSNFNIKKVSNFSQTKISKLLVNEGIIRNKLKVKSIVNNASAFLEIQKEFKSFDNFIWSYFEQGAEINYSKKETDYPSQSKLSEEISKVLKKRGFSFVGPTVVYSYLQSAGMINDHKPGCYLHGKKIKRKA